MTNNTYILDPEDGTEMARRRMHMVDFSADSEAWDDMFHNNDIALRAMQLKLIKAGIATQEEFDRLHQQFSIDMHLNTFRGVMPYMSAWGKKP